MGPPGTCRILAAKSGAMSNTASGAFRTLFGNLRLLTIFRMHLAEFLFSDCLNVGCPPLPVTFFDPRRVCMKPSQKSGTTSSFYLKNFGATGNVRGSEQNEIDVEFVGKSHNMVQTNFFSRLYDPDANSGSGNEQQHDLGFDATQTWAAYSFHGARTASTGG